MQSSDALQGVGRESLPGIPSLGKLSLEDRLLDLPGFLAPRIGHLVTVVYRRILLPRLGLPGTRSYYGISLSKLVERYIAAVFFPWNSSGSEASVEGTVESFRCSNLRLGRKDMGRSVGLGGNVGFSNASDKDPQSSRSARTIHCWFVVRVSSCTEDQACGGLIPKLESTKEKFTS